MLALALVVVVNLPASSLAEDIAFHDGHNRIELATSFDVAANGLDAKDPGLVGHLHCGCHVLAILDAIVLAPILEPSRPRYARVSEVAPSLALDRLPRPPRA
ncbi:hypothetical protein [Methylobacterium indicum]|nr:hypothetical protein [Methylobacterium indicum]